MSNPDIIRAWKDEAFRANLGETLLPENPAGQIELSDESLSGVQAADGALMIAVTRMNTGTNCLSDICGFCSGYCP
jgi:mersacidin/lichenicidin family type 2 lantibiotic